MFHKMISVTSKGQITLPKPVRERMKLSENDVIVLVAKDGKVFLQRAVDYLQGGNQNE